MNHKAEIIPTKSPQVILAAGFVKSLAGAPIATPFAKEALRMSSMSIFSLKKAVIMKDPRQLPVKEIIVFIMITVFYCTVTGKYPALKYGQ